MILNSEFYVIGKENEILQCDISTSDMVMDLLIL